MVRKSEIYSGMLIRLSGFTALFFIFPPTHLAQAQEQTIFGGANDLVYAAGLEHQSEAAPSSNPSLDIQEQKLNLFVPLAGKETGQGYAVYFRGQRTKLGERLVFPSSSIEVPDHFGTAEVGAYWRFKDDSGNRKALSFSFGTAGSRLLDSSFTPIVTGNLVFEKPSSEDTSWIYLINYANNRATLNHVPLPGFAWVKKQKTKTLVLGLPFSFVGLRHDPIYVNAALSPFIASVDGSWRFWGPLMTYSSMAWLPKAYQNLVAGSEDRLIVEKKEWAIGLRLSFGPKGSVSLGHVWNIDRRIFLGASLSRRSTAAIEPEDSGGLIFKGRVTF